ncbi:LCCL domain-containing protein [Sarocladium implicatum]|nr:LCCL domain-containing protein [Sarocladium implicatum]
MAAPPDKNIKNLTGQWYLNKSISDSIDPILVIQGISWFLRTAIGAASVHLDINQYQGPPRPPHESTDIYTHVDIEQTAAGLKGTHEKRTLDGFDREHQDWLFGSVKGKSQYVGLADLDDEFLKKGWIKEEGKEGDEDKFLILSHVVSLDNGWVAKQVWGFQEHEGQRRYARNILVTKDQQRAEVRLFYDFIEPA